MANLWNEYAATAGGVSIIANNFRKLHAARSRTEEFKSSDRIYFVEKILKNAEDLQSRENEFYTAIGCKDLADL